MSDLQTIVAIVALMVVGTSTASALEPETADLVSSNTVQIPSSFDIDDDGTAFVGISECESMLSDSLVSVVFATLFNPQTSGDLIEEVDMFTVPRDSTARIDCLSGELCTVIDTEDVDFTDTGVSIELAFADILATGDFTACSGFDQEFFVRLIVEESTADSSTTENADARIIVDTIRPAAPSGVAASATENTIAVSFEASADTDVNRYFVYWSTTAFEGGQNPDDLSLERAPIGDGTSGDVSVELVAGGDLFVAVAAEDYAGNLSALSGVVQASVIETNDFWEQYRLAGGEEAGGCSTTPGQPSPWLLVFGLAMLGIRRRRRLAATTILSAALFVIPATASAESPTWGAFEIKLGGYYPAIDNEFGGSGPFGDVFGSKNLLLGELEVDGWLWQGFGKLGIGASIGYSRVKGGAVTEAATDESAIEDTTTFGIFPLRASVVYRLDWLAQNTRIPVSAGVKVGPDFYRWRITDSNGGTASYDGDAGAGWKKGFHFVAGLQLLLDFIDPSAAAAFDMSWGINNSYLFAEFMMTKVDDFGGAGLDLSDNMWLFGLSFEF